MVKVNEVGLDLTEHRLPHSIVRRHAGCRQWPTGRGVIPTPARDVFVIKLEMVMRRGRDAQKITGKRRSQIANMFLGAAASLVAVDHMQYTRPRIARHR